MDKNDPRPKFKFNKNLIIAIIFCAALVVFLAFHYRVNIQNYIDPLLHSNDKYQGCPPYCAAFF